MRARPVYVESESRKIGAIQVPDALLDAMRRAACVRVDTPRELRVALLKEEYLHFIEDPALARGQAEPLVPVHGRKVIDQWMAAATRGDFDMLIDELLSRITTRPMVARYCAIFRATPKRCA